MSQISEVKNNIGRLYSVGLDYDSAKKQFFESVYEKFSKEKLETIFDEEWNRYEHMYFANLSFFKKGI